jgi:hypothetical protein
MKKIGRKEALFAFVAGLVPWVASRAIASPKPTASPADPAAAASPAIDLEGLQTQIAGLTRELQELQTLVASQVGFTKAANGDLTLTGSGAVKISAATVLNLQSLNTQVNGSATVAVKGGLVTLN